MYSAGEGRGSTFTLKIPLLDSTHKAHSQSTSSVVDVEVDADVWSNSQLDSSLSPRLSELLLTVASSHGDTFEGISALAGGDFEGSERDGMRDRNGEGVGVRDRDGMKERDGMRDRDRDGMRERERDHTAIPIGAEDLLLVLESKDTEDNGCCDETSSFIPEITILDPSPDPVPFKCGMPCTRMLAAPPSSPEKPVTESCHQRFNILVVDDSKLNRKMLVKSLKTESHRCEEAEDGLEAVRMVTKRSEFKTDENESLPSSYYDAILMDFMMPIMDGPTATKVLRDMGYKGVIIGVTGNALPSDVEYFTGKGANKVLIKPVDVDVLLLTVHSLLSSC